MSSLALRTEDAKLYPVFKEPTVLYRRQTYNQVSCRVLSAGINVSKKSYGRIGEAISD